MTTHDIDLVVNRNLPAVRDRILLTGISGSLGRITARALCKTHNVIGVDMRPFPGKPKEIEFHTLDLRRKSAFSLLKKRKPNVIIHIGVIRNPLKHIGTSTAYYFNLEITSQLLKLAEQLNVKKFIFLSTANLYGPSATTAGFISEDAPLHGANRSPELRDLVSLDMMIQSFFWKQPHIETVILRPVHIVSHELKNAPSRYLTLDSIPTLLGYDPMLQLVDAKDVVQAITLSLKPNLRGIFNIVGESQAPLSRIINMLHNNTYAVPEFIFRTFIRAIFRYGFSSFPPGELDHLKYTCLVDGNRAKIDLGYRPKISMMNILRNLNKKRTKKIKLISD
ncbi:MAG: NAD-dependent epimerase/dehydratase family protein [bacterium]|nr:NAD-dependent epimerase/dehydratase family protein [bacterium]